MRVSVAMCTYNGAAFVHQQVRSILDQSRAVDELIVADDGSVDGTVDLVRRTIAEHREAGRPTPTTTVIEPAGRLGVTANFERAIRATTGDLVALSDQDDVWRADRIEASVVAFADQPGLSLLHSDARLIDADGRPQQSTLLQSIEITSAERAALQGGGAFDALMHRNLVTGATVMMDRALFDRAAPFPAPWVHDEWLAVVAAATGRVLLSNESLIDYRQHGRNEIGASKLSLSGRVGRITASRGDRNDRLLARASVMEERLCRLDGVPQHVTEAASGKRRHEEFRSGLPASRPRRVGPVLGHGAGGSYARYGRGVADMVRDILQPV